MSNLEALNKKLLELLRTIDFDKQYFDFYWSHRDWEKKDMPKTGAEVFKAALATTSLDFKHSTKENFFSHKEVHGSCSLTLNVAFRDSTAEFILSIKTEHGVMGGPFHSLANEVGHLRDPNFSPDPAYPRLPFSNEDQLREVMQFGVSLFEDAKRVVLSKEGLEC